MPNAKEAGISETAHGTISRAGAESFARLGAYAAQPCPHGVEIQVLHARLADDLVASGPRNNAQLGLRAGSVNVAGTPSSR